MIENQLDSSMKKVMLGFSKKYTLNDSGCLVHCIARLLNKPRLEVHDKLKEFKCFYADSTKDVCLLDLTKVPLAYPQLKYIGKKEFNQELALNAIKQAGGLITEVDYNPIMNGTQQHFVFLRGNKEMEDPLGGVVRSSTHYPIISIRIFEVVELPQGDENMLTDNEKTMLGFIRDNKITEGQLRQGYGYITDKIDEKVEKLEDSIKELKEKVDELDGKLDLEQKLALDWQREYESANNKVKNLELQTLSASSDSLIFKEAIDRLLKVLKVK